MALEKLRHDWDELDPKARWLLIAIVVGGLCFVGFRAMQPDKPKPLAPLSSAPMLDANGNLIDPNKRRLLPETPRNQGLEELVHKLDALTLEVAQIRAKPAVGSAAAMATPGLPAASSVSNSINLDAALPPPVSFEAPAAARGVSASASSTRAGLPPGDPLPPPVPPPVERRMKIWAAEAVDAIDEAELPAKIIPVNSALESVMLTGINARPTGSIAGAVGSAIAANSVGAPFVTRIKGDAILPNGWKLDDLGDCFLGGSGIAILSTERAYVIAANLSCVSPGGLVYEGPIKAYGVDADGTLGIAGKVVSKQGTLLLQAALTGLASGLGSALSPQAIPAYNSNATGGTAGVQYPNPGVVAQTAVGTGINQASNQLSKFYLEYAKEVFPVVEVTSQTRVTWVLSESVELKPHFQKAVRK